MLQFKESGNIEINKLDLEDLLNVLLENGENELVQEFIENNYLEDELEN